MYQLGLEIIAAFAEEFFLSPDRVPLGLHDVQKKFLFLFYWKDGTSASSGQGYISILRSPLLSSSFRKILEANPTLLIQTFYHS